MRLFVIVLAGLLIGCSINEPGSISVFMCPQCEAVFVDALQNATNIQCALYDVGPTIGEVLAEKHAQVITDDESKPAYGTPYVHSGLMHHKFCVLDTNTVLTGSYNPTEGGSINKNNLLIIHSKTLAKNYREEYTRLATGKQARTVHSITLNGTQVENYFCPRDKCEEAVLATLSEAKQSITFMTFSFTSDAIGKLLQEKSSQGVHVEGICDKGQMSIYSECQLLNAKNYTGEGLLHHKVFIIDHSTIITGSYNPTASGDRRNNENIIIFKNATLASQFETEYNAIKLI